MCRPGGRCLGLAGQDRCSSQRNAGERRYAWRKDRHAYAATKRRSPDGDPDTDSFPNTHPSVNSDGNSHEHTVADNDTLAHSHTVTDKDTLAHNHTVTDNDTVRVGVYPANRRHGGDR